MQDRYVGDIGDFGKYGLIRKVFSNLDSPVEDLKLGVIWCFNNTTHNSWTPLITPEEYKYLDEPLFNALQKLIREDRGIAGVQRSNILPTQIFFDMPISGISKKERVDWITTAIEKTKEAGVVFFDPDTGIATKKMTDKDSEKKSALSKRSAEHIYIDELRQFVRAGKSLIVYQHSDYRNYSSPKDQIQFLAKRLRNEGKIPNAIRIFWWHNRFFVVIIQQHHKSLVNALDAFQETSWAKSGLYTEETHWLVNLDN